MGSCERSERKTPKKPSMPNVAAGNQYRLGNWMRVALTVVADVEINKHAQFQHHAVSRFAV